MIINHEGQSYEITNWDEFKEQVLHDIGIQVESEIVKNVNSMRLVDTGRFKGSITSGVTNGELVITSTVPYAVYLEYGTYAYWQNYGLMGFPKTLDPKKKDIHTISILVANKPGVLVRVALVFARRGYNIDALSVSPGFNPRFSRMTITAKGDPATLDQIIKQVAKLIDVIHASEHTGNDAVTREFALLKVKSAPSIRSKIIAAIKARKYIAVKRY